MKAFLKAFVAVTAAVTGSLLLLIGCGTKQQPGDQNISWQDANKQTTVHNYGAAFMQNDQADQYRKPQ